MAETGARAVGLLEAWERREYDKVMEMFAPGATVRDMPRGIELTDRAEIRDWVVGWVTACSDAVAGATAAASDDGAAVIQGTYKGTNDGPFGPMPATGRTVSMPFAIAMRFTPAGLVTDYDVYYDMLSLLTQLGHVPATS